MGGAVVLYELPISFLEEVEYTIQEKKFKFFTIWSSCRVVEQGTCIWGTGTIWHDGTIFSQNFHMDWRYSLGVAPLPVIVANEVYRNPLVKMSWSLESWERGLGAPSHKVSEYKAGIYGSAAQRRTLSKWSASGMDIAARLVVSICVGFPNANHSRWFNSWPFYCLVGGHLTLLNCHVFAIPTQKVTMAELPDMVSVE